ncbi:unnamed protein product, partial [Urochloa humidicola]
GAAGAGALTATSSSPTPPRAPSSAPSPLCSSSAVRANLATGGAVYAQLATLRAPRWHHPCQHVRQVPPPRAEAQRRAWAGAPDLLVDDPPNG